jgi:hypothetical protein
MEMVGLYIPAVEIMLRLLLGKVIYVLAVVSIVQSGKIAKNV